MAAEIEAQLGVKPTLKEGRGGIFEIRKDGRLVFDKARLDRFPEPGEALGLLRA